MKRMAVPANPRSASSASRASEYATPDEFCLIFDRNMEELYTLALLLTTNEMKAEQCFSSAFAECQRSATVFKPWAHSWSRLAIIENAITMIRPTAADIAEGTENASPDVTGLHPAAASVMRLPAFERFVFVLTTLDQYSVRDCAILLRWRPQEIQQARRRAIEFLANPVNDSAPPRFDAKAEPNHSDAAGLSAS